ncbi:MAG TPA: hypothetical protein DCO77_08315 [Nitrospiraceae bacterium]|nr:hypothetical protein [Nitrospiraceae bacterium]
MSVLLWILFAVQVLHTCPVLLFSRFESRNVYRKFKNANGARRFAQGDNGRDVRNTLVLIILPITVA